ncbi:MAG: lycopene cyclase domain-containing protein [Ignavibacteria bacterium]|nr:lycopene cyclase domain-containing protein [Ignavibacteria bacterium]
MLITLGLDIYITKTKVVTRGVFWIFLAVMYFFKLLMNGYLTWRPIVIYNPDHFMNLRIGTIPAEDFIYAFTLVTLPIILWEKLRKS